jgi:hypothetical protein
MRQHVKYLGIDFNLKEVVETDRYQYPHFPPTLALFCTPCLLSLEGRETDADSVAGKADLVMLEVQRRMEEMEANMQVGKTTCVLCVTLAEEVKILRLFGCFVFSFYLFWQPTKVNGNGRV